MRVLEDFGQFGLDSGDAHWLQNDKDLVNLARTKVMFEQVLKNSFKFLVIEAFWSGKYQEAIPTGEAKLQTSQDAHLQSELPKLGFLRKWGMPQFLVILTANVLIFGKFVELR